MKEDIIILLALMGACVLTKELFIFIKRIIEAITNIFCIHKTDYMVCNENNNIIAYIHLSDINDDPEKMMQINKTLFDNHGYKIVKMIRLGDKK